MKTVICTAMPTCDLILVEEWNNGIKNVSYLTPKECREAVQEDRIVCRCNDKLAAPAVQSRDQDYIGYPDRSPL